jgi:hypothetical protein
MPLGMRRLVLVTVVVTLLLTACTTRQKIAGGGAALAGVGLVLSFSNEERSEEEAMDTKGKIGIACLLGGLAVLFVAAALDESDTDDSPKVKEIKVAEKPPEVAPTGLAAAQKRRDQAKLLTKEAHDAAAAGDCAKVQELSAQVGAIDRLYYGEIFMKDEAVQKCFQPATPPAEAPAPVPPATPTTP